MNELLEAALDYASKGLAVLPLQPKDKPPLTKNGFKGASTDPDIIKKWWSEWPNANIGIATGNMSGGLVVVDQDIDKDAGKDGYRVFKKWCDDNCLYLPETWQSITGRGGYHTFLKSAFPVSSRIAWLDGVDIKADGGYIVAPPSVHPNGNKYEWEYDPDNYNIASGADDEDVTFLLLEINRSIKEAKTNEPVQSRQEVPKGKRLIYMIQQAGLMMIKCYSFMDNETMLKALMEKAHKELEQDASLDYKYLERNLKHALVKFRAADEKERERYANVDWEKCKAIWKKKNPDKELPDPLPFDELLAEAEADPEGIPKKKAKQRAKALIDEASKRNDGNNIAEVIPKLSLNSENEIATTAYNYLTILRYDKHFDNIRFNLLRHFPEKLIDDKRIQWVDSDDAAARIYIERNYGINNPKKYDDAFMQYQMEKAFNPLTDKIKSLCWDGKNRTDQFFIRWLGCEDTNYSREVSRLFFAGGISRAFNHGCKFDDVVVLISSQGGGKSTICEWLALEPEFYSSTKTISGQKGLEAIQGKWIVELEELLAVIANEKAGTKVEEAAKAYLSGKVDYYRLPYSKRPQDIPRTNIFIGSTNRDTFLTDKTGNRRWYPLVCKSSAYNLYDHEKEVKEDIRQCWAEMYQAFKDHKAMAKPYADKLLIDTIKAEQNNAECDDWREGVIAEYVKKLDRVCCLQIWNEALNKGQKYTPELSQKESREIGMILVNRLGWIKGYPENFGDILGKQRAYKRPDDHCEEATTDW